ncbi:MAG: hypothetical protein QOD84_1508, partial [Acidobacteriaceae bacterium]
APPIFDSDPNHIWNGTFECLFVRQSSGGKHFGADVVDPLLWADTRHLLTGASHRQALGCLDEFLKTHAESKVHDPVKRAVFQHDLWAVFDWVATGDNFPKRRSELETRLARVIRRVALTPEEVAALPDNYRDAIVSERFPTAYDSHSPLRPFLPPDLLRPDGAWLCLSAHSDEPTANEHFSGRSRFLIFIQLPGGREVTKAYVRKFRSWSAPLFLNDAQGHPYLLNLSLPQFPKGPQVLLLRQAIVINAQGNLVPTTMTESVQIRAYHSITPGSNYTHYTNGPSSHDQDFFEFRMRRPELFTHPSGGLIAVQPGEKEYATFNPHGKDAFESASPFNEEGVVLERCRACHSDSGIHSVESRTQWITGSQWVDQEDSDDPIAWETMVTLARKQRQPEFTLLRRLWRSTPK